MSQVRNLHSKKKMCAWSSLFVSVYGSVCLWVFFVYIVNKYVFKFIGCLLPIVQSSDWFVAGWLWKTGSYYKLTWFVCFNITMIDDVFFQLNRIYLSMRRPITIWVQDLLFQNHGMTFPTTLSANHLIKISQCGRNSILKSFLPSNTLTCDWKIYFSPQSL